MLIFIKVILLPISAIYGLITWIRNVLYTIGIYDVYVCPVPSIGVGNITIGGTGKTPMVELLIRKYAHNRNIAILSRGYGRRTEGFIEATSSSKSEDIGDEPLQIFRKFSEVSKVFVCENRKVGIEKILSLYPNIDLLILDDAFQHRAVKPSINILLSDFNRPFYTDWILPTGLLRESRWGAKRADAVIITKAPPLLSEHSKITIRRDIRKYLKSSNPVFFSYLKYTHPISFSNASKLMPKNSKVFLITGIANPKPLSDYIKSNYKLIGHLAYNDHRNYNSTDIKHILKKFNDITESDKVILTTEKDYVKLNTPILMPLFGNTSIYYISIESDIIDFNNEFDLFLSNSLA